MEETQKFEVPFLGSAPALSPSDRVSLFFFWTLSLLVRSFHFLMDKILDFLHLSLGDKSKKEESEPLITAGHQRGAPAIRHSTSTGNKSVVDKSFQFPEPEEPLQARGPIAAGLDQGTSQEESHRDEEIQTPEFRKPGKNVAVKNLPRQLKKGELEKILSAGPKPKNITFVRNNGKFHGMVLIKYPTAQDAALAVATLNGIPVKGKPIIVEYKKKTKRDKLKEDKQSESESANDSPQSAPCSRAELEDTEAKSESEKVDATDQFVVPFRRHSIAYPNSAWRRSSNFAGYESGNLAAFRRNSIACFTPESNWNDQVLPAFSPVRQPKGPEETRKGFAGQNTRRLSAIELH